MFAAGRLGGWGGGVSSVVLVGLGGFGGGASSVVLIGLRGWGGGASSSLLNGSLGGSWSSLGLEGNLGNPLAAGITGAEFTDTRGTFPFIGLGGGSSLPLSSRPRGFGGGRTDSLAASKAGGSLLWASTEEVLVLEDGARDVPKDMPEMLELIEELDVFRPNCAEPFRGGRAGDVSDAARVGRGGGNLRAGFGDGNAGRGLSLSTGGGGRTAFLTSVGKTFACLEASEPYVGIGGLFAVCVRSGATGRLFEVGIGGGGLLPNV